jgi:hypothetical protein
MKVCECCLATSKETKFVNIQQKTGQTEYYGYRTLCCDCFFGLEKLYFVKQRKIPKYGKGVNCGKGTLTVRGLP